MHVAGALFLVCPVSELPAMNAFIQYFRGSLEELRHVTWPTQQQAIRLTGITIGFIIVTAAFFGIVDGSITEAIRLTIR